MLPRERPLPPHNPSLPMGSALLAGLLTAAGLSSVLFIRPAPASSWTGLVAGAIGYVVIAAAACAAAFTISVLMRGRSVPGDLPLATVRCATTAAWMPALVLFFADRSAGTALAAGLLAAGVTSVLRTQVQPLVPPERDSMFSALRISDTDAWFRTLLRRIGAVLLMHGATAIALADRLPVAVALSAAGSVLLVLTIPAGWPAPLGPTVARRSAGVFAAAVALTVIALLPYQLGGAGTGEGDAGTAVARHRAAERSETGSGTSSDLSPTYPGVILWAEEQRHAVLVPPLPALGRALFRPADTQPLSIPFFGAYWFFRRPQKEPPPNSVIVRGNPVEKGFRSTDRVPLLMQARQNLGRTIDLRCCSAIQIAISNNDRYAGTVGIELVLMNSMLAGRPALSLGRQDVSSTPRWRPGAGDTIAAETLTYNIFGGSELERFDEIVVLFHLGRIRADKSAKIAIERFVLVPRRG